MSNEARRHRRQPDQIVTREATGGEANQPSVMPLRLRKGIREALDGGHGRLRMDPQDLADLIGATIDMEVERLARERREYEQRRRIASLLKQPPSIFVDGKSAGGGPVNDTQRRAIGKDLGRQTSETDRPMGLCRNREQKGG